MSRTDGIFDYERADRIIAYGMIDRRVGPEHMSFRRIFRPTANIQMVFIILIFQDISSPIGTDIVFNPVIHIARNNFFGSPYIGAQFSGRHRKKTVYEPGTFDKIIPLSGTRPFCDLCSHTLRSDTESDRGTQ